MRSILVLKTIVTYNRNTLTVRETAIIDNRL